MNRQIREAIIKHRLSISANDYHRMSNIITLKLISNDYFIQAKVIAVYLPIKQEVDTLSIIENAIALGKQVVVPKIKGSKLIMVEYQSPFRHSNYGILEPVNDVIIDRSHIDLINVRLLVLKKRCEWGMGKDIMMII